MTWVLCIVVFSTAGLKNHETVREKGLIVDDYSDNWIVDFSQYLKTRPDLVKWNNLVQTVDSNGCLYVK